MVGQCIDKQTLLKNEIVKPSTQIIKEKIWSNISLSAIIEASAYDHPKGNCLQKHSRLEQIHKKEIKAAYKEN